MPEISKGSLYDINDIIDVWESGWKEFAQLGERLVLTTAHGVRHSVSNNFLSFKVYNAFCEIYRDMILSEHIDTCDIDYGAEKLFALAATPRNENFVRITGSYAEDNLEYRIEFLPSGGWFKRKSRKEEAARLKFIGRVTKAFASSTTVKEAFSKIGTAKQRNQFARCYSKEGWEKELMTKIQGHWSKAIKWLDYGLQNEKTWEEAFWNCIWLYIEPDIEVMLDIESHINKRVPLTNDQLHILNKHMNSGYPQGYRIEHYSGKGETYELVLEPEVKVTGIGMLKAIASSFLSQPAFSLAGELRTSCSKSQFIRKCRAPSCGKMFYTRRANATACPGSQGDKKNMCALEWVRYKRYLLKIDKNPEADWNKDDFKKQFISYDNS